MNLASRQTCFYPEEDSKVVCVARMGCERLVIYNTMRTILATLVLALLLGCTSLTPDRVNVIAAIAGQAAAVGTAEWLAKHPEHRASFDAVIAALVALQRAGNTNEDAAVQLLSSLPTDALRGPDGELYVAGDGGLVVWDGVLKKSVAVRGPATVPVIKETLRGLRRATGPKPPLPPSPKLALPPGVVAREMEGAPTNVASVRSASISNLIHAINMPTNHVPASSTFDVTLNEHGIQQVNVRWVMAPNALYTVQRMEDKTWEGYSYAQNTNTVATPWVWTTLWPAPVAVGSWRVVRR